MTGEAAIREAAARIAAAGDSRPRAARDPVNLPMIRNWLEALSPAAPDPAAVDPPAVDPPAPDPAAVDPPVPDPAAPDPAVPDPAAPDPAVPQPPAGLTVPPAMIQVWTMPGLHGVRADDDPLGQMVRVLDQAGYTSVVATNCDQTYRRYLKLGEQLTVRARLLDVTGPKAHRPGRGLVRHHPQHLVLLRRAGRHHGLPHPQVPPAPVQPTPVQPTPVQPTPVQPASAQSAPGLRHAAGRAATGWPTAEVLAATP